MSLESHKVPAALTGHALRAATGMMLLASSPLLAQQSFDVAMQDGLLSIRANNTPIMELVEALADETGINFVVTGNAAESVTTEILDEPFVDAVAKLSPNHLLVKNSKREDAEVIEVVLMLDDKDSGGGGDGFLPSGAPADEIIGGNASLPNDQGPGENGFTDLQQDNAEALTTNAVDDPSIDPSLDPTIDPLTGELIVNQSGQVPGGATAPNVLPLK